MARFSFNSKWVLIEHVDVVMFQMYNYAGVAPILNSNVWEANKNIIVNLKMNHKQ